MMGLLESVREPRRSGSSGLGKEMFVGVGTVEDWVAVAGVPSLETVLRECAWVSIRRIGGGW